MNRAGILFSKPILLYIWILAASVGIGLLSAGGIIAAMVLCFTLGFVTFYWLSQRPQSFIHVLLVLLPLNSLLNVVSYHFFHLEGAQLSMLQMWKDGLLATSFLYWLLSHCMKPSDYAPIRHSVALFALFYVAWELAYAVLPIGPASMSDKLYAVRTDLWYILFFFVGLLIQKEVNLKKVMKWLLGIALLMSVIALVEKGINAIPILIWLGIPDYFQMVTGGVYPTQGGLPFTYFAHGGIRRVGSLLLNPLDLASFIIFALPTVFLIQHQWKRLLCTGLLVTAVLFTRSRMAILLMIMEVVVLFYWQYPKYRKLLIGSVCLAFAGLVVIIPIFFPDLMHYMIQTFTFQESSAEGHAHNWILAISTMMENPMGVGLATAGLVGARSGYFYGGENQYLITAVQLGWGGLLIFLLLLGSVVTMIIKLPSELRLEKMWLLSAVLYLSLSGLSQQSFINISLTSITFIILGLLNREWRNAK